MIYLAVDLGQAGDYTAVTATELIPVPGARDEWGKVAIENNYHVRYAQRYPLGISYVDIIKAIKKLIATPQLSSHRLVVDATGCGRPVIDMMRSEGLQPVPVSITGGEKESWDIETGYWHVPKRVLVSNVQVLLGNAWLKFADNIAERKTIRDELQNFKLKISKAGNDTYEAWREGDHDDLVLSICLGCWCAEKFSGNIRKENKKVIHPMRSPALKGII